jgi:hypothetical protein
MEAKMSARTGRLFLAASLALAPGLLLAQDRAVPRGGGGEGGGSSAGARQPSSSGVSSSSASGSGSSNGSSSGYTGSSSSGSGSTTAERRHPRAGTGSGSNGYYPGYPGYGWGGYYPGYGGYWWPYAYSGWYGSGYWGAPGYGGAVYYSSTPNEGGSIRVLCDPAEARVYVDGYYAGVVDDFDGLFQRLHVAPGRHEITLKLEGYTSHRMRVYVGPDATVKLHHEMQRGTGETFEDLTGGAPPPEREIRGERSRDQFEAPAPEEPRPPAEDRAGRLNLRVQPEDASVYVDGAFRGNGHEAATLRLAPGRHRIEVVRPGFRTSEQEFDVAPGEPTQLSITLERPQL